MNSLLQIKDRLWEELSELYEACDYEHALLEEGTDLGQKNSTGASADFREAA